MGTRGMYGFRINGTDKCTYNHYDSYPEVLGRDITRFAATVRLEAMKEFASAIKLVDAKTPPTDEQIEKCKRYGYCDFGVSTKSETDWYCLTRKLQGDFAKMAESMLNEWDYYMPDESEFIKDSLFCEYAYIINLDTGTLEYYKGFQREPQDGNRYGEEPNDDGYYPCRLVLEIPLCDANALKNAVNEMKRIDDALDGESEELPF